MAWFSGIFVAVHRWCCGPCPMAVMSHWTMTIFPKCRKARHPSIGLHGPTNWTVLNYCLQLVLHQIARRRWCILLWHFVLFTFKSAAVCSVAVAATCFWSWWSLSSCLANYSWLWIVYILPWGLWSQTSLIAVLLRCLALGIMLFMFYKTQALHTSPAVCLRQVLISLSGHSLVLSTDSDEHTVLVAHSTGQMRACSSHLFILLIPILCLFLISNWCLVFVSSPSLVKLNLAI